MKNLLLILSIFTTSCSVISDLKIFKCNGIIEKIPSNYKPYDFSSFERIPMYNVSTTESGNTIIYYYNEDKVLIKTLSCQSFEIIN